MARPVKAYLLVMTLLLLLPLQGAAQRLAIKTNVLSLATATPNLGFELVTGERLSLSISAFGSANPYWSDHSLGEETGTSFFAMRPEIRYWFNGRPLTRFYAGVNVLAATYDFPLWGMLHKGTAAGPGLSFGYVINLGKRLDLEFTSGAGLLFYWGKRFSGDTPLPAEDTMPDTKGYKLTPNQLGISLVYIIK
jgi:hypothetical protein